MKIVVLIFDQVRIVELVRLLVELSVSEFHNEQ